MSAKNPWMREEFGHQFGLKLSAGRHGFRVHWKPNWVCESWTGLECPTTSKFDLNLDRKIEKKMDRIPLEIGPKSAETGFEFGLKLIFSWV